MNTITKIEPLEITDAREAQFRVGSWHTFGALSVRHSRRPFYLEVAGDNFQATFDANADDLRDIRDWINTALASVEPHTEGVGA